MKIGVIGGGQLGRMLALAGIPLGHEFTFIEPGEIAPMTPVATHIVAPYDDPVAIQELSDWADVVTYEFENVPLESARMAEERATVYPPIDALEAMQDRYLEKLLLVRSGVDCAPFALVNSASSLDTAIEQIGLPGILKSRRLGYDGKGQIRLNTPAQVESARSQLDIEYVYEGFVPFDRELSLILARSANGDTTVYQLVENHHRDGILRLTVAPAPNLNHPLELSALNIAAAIVKATNYVGVLAIELFQVGDQLLVNEMAPRVHNSGHWTQDGAASSQFENHVRAICGLPLGSPEASGFSAMINIIGEFPFFDDVLSCEHAHLHLYGKAARPGRKLGHINLVAGSDAQRTELLLKFRSIIES